MTSTIAKIDSTVNSRFDEYLELLVGLVKCPTCLGDTRSAQELLYRHARRMGLMAELWDLNLEDLVPHADFAPVSWGYAGQPNMRAIMPAPGSGGRSLVLNGHIDVVSPEPIEWWTYDPWQATIDGDRLYGRGSLDMKSGLVAALLAIHAVMDTGIQLRAPVIFESVIEEECTGNGMLASRLRTGTVDGAIILEPTDLQTWSATPGVLWAEVAVSGRPAYVGRKGEYINAIEMASAIIHGIREPLISELNSAFDHPAFAMQERPLTMSVGMISGGDWPSLVPLECCFTCRMSYPIRWSFEDARTFFEHHLTRTADTDPWLAEHPPTVHYPGFRALGWEASLDSPLAHTLALHHEAVLDSPLVFTGFPGTADARYFNTNAGEQAMYYGPSGGNIHAPDEYVELKSIQHVARVLAHFIVDWCG